jgi:23S rRNA (uracil1939-C5)-methyltransferase
VRDNGGVQKSEELAMELTLPVEKLVYGGAGLSRHEGRVVLTPFVLPGETVQIAIDRDKKDVLNGRVLEILQPAEARTKPPCHVFGRCGGCHYQHALYPAQIEIKKGVLREVLQRIGKLEAPDEIAAITGEPWGYRNRIQLHIDGQKVGYRESGSHRVIDTSECPVASPRLNEALRAIRRMVRNHRFPRFVRSIEFFTNERDIQVNVLETMAGQRVARPFFDWLESELPGAATGPIEYAANGNKFRVHYKSFFQVNRFLVGALTNAAIGDASGGYAIELYAGVGLFSLSMAGRFERFDAVESVKNAVEDAEANAKRAGVRVSQFRASSDEFLANVKETPDFVLADPPRAGLGPAVVKELARLKPPRIGIVSCDPSTLARDLKGLTEAGYKIRSMTLVDLFPQTYHLETVTHLEI